MSQALADWVDVAPDVQQLITEDDEPVDNLPSEKQQRLLTETLYSSWAGPGENRTFLAAANIGVFYLARRPAIVPDVLLSLDVEVPEDWWEKEHRSYFLWEFGKPPDLAIEIVSNKEGKEDGEKKQIYARMRVPYYIIYDPQQQIMSELLTVYRLQDFSYQKQETADFPTLGLGLRLWAGPYEGKNSQWLRWVTADGEMVLSGKERAAEEHQRAEAERQRAAAAERRESQMLERAQKAEALLEQERQRAKRLEEMLRELGKDPT